MSTTSPPTTDTPSADKPKRGSRAKRAGTPNPTTTPPAPENGSQTAPSASKGTKAARYPAWVPDAVRRSRVISGRARAVPLAA
jgi:hypothetical protein